MHDSEIKKHIEYWLASAKHDYKTMTGLFSIKRYPDSLFYGHLVLEKILKTILVRNSGEYAPRIHDLLRLAEIAKLQLTEEQKDILDIVNDFNISSRYPDFKMEFYKKCNKKYTEKHLNNIKGLYKMLCQRLKKL